MLPLAAEAEVAKPIADPELSASSNLALSAAGGRVVGVPSNDFAKDRLIDGKLKNGWRAGEDLSPVEPTDIVIELGGGTATIDRVVIRSGHWQRGRLPKEVEIAVSASGPKTGFEAVGVYLLKEQKSLQSLAFAPRPARFVRVRILSIYEGRPGKPRKAAIGEIMVLEAAEPPAGAVAAPATETPEAPPPSAASATETAEAPVAPATSKPAAAPDAAEPASPPAGSAAEAEPTPTLPVHPIEEADVGPAVNVAAFANGGWVASVPSYKSERIRMIDGDSYTNWLPQRADLPHDLVFSFFGDREALLEKVVVMPDKGRGFPKEIEVAVSSSAEGDDFRTVGRAQMRPVMRFQEIAFAPVRARRLKLRVLSTHAGGRYGIVELMALESQGRPSILEGVRTRPVAEVAKSDRMANLADPALGGRVIWVSSRAADKDKLIGPSAGSWLTAGAAAGQGFVLGFLDGREARLDRLLLRPVVGGYSKTAVPREVEVSYSNSEQAGDFTPLGTYLLDNVEAYQELSFPAVRARRLRVAIRSVYRAIGGEPYTLRAAIDDVIVPETPAAGETTLLAEAFTEPLAGQTAGRLNIAWNGLGGRVVAATSEYAGSYPYNDNGWFARYLTDGSHAASPGWSGNDGPGQTQQLILAFRDGQVATIDTVVLDSRVEAGGRKPARHVRLFELHASTAESFQDEAGFAKIGTYILDSDWGPRVVRFAPTEARFLKLIVRSTYGGKAPVLGEVKVFEAAGRASVLADAEFDIADSRLGGHLAFFSTQEQERNASLLIDHRDEKLEKMAWATPETRGEEDFPIRLVIGFRDGREALLRKIVVVPSATDPPETRIKDLRVLVSRRSPVADFRTAAFDRPQPLVLSKEGGPWELVFNEPTPARYVELRILSNHGGSRTTLGKVRVIEETAGGRHSILVEARPGSEAVGARATTPGGVEPFACGGADVVCETEANDTPATANPLQTGKTVAGRTRSGETDFFALAPEEPFNTINVEMESRPYIRTSVGLEDETGNTVKTFSPATATTPRFDWSWNVPAGRYRFRVSQPRTTVALVFDTSGSMEGRTEHLREALVSYIRGAPADEDIRLIRFGADVEEIDPEKAQQQVKDACPESGSARQHCLLIGILENTGKDRVIYAKGGTSFFDAIVAAKEAVGKVGNRAIIAMTDGKDSTSKGASYRKFWETVETDSVRIYTIGLGEPLSYFWDVFSKDYASTGADTLRAMAEATGGRFLFTPASERLVDLYGAVREEISSDTFYRLKADVSRGMGTLRIEEIGERVVAPNAAAIDLVVDLSGSMGWCLNRDVRCPKEKNRLTAAKKALIGMIEDIPDGVLLGLRAFGFPPSNPNASKRDRCLSTTGQVAKIVPMNADYRGKLIEWIGQRVHGGRKSQTAMGYSLSQIPGDFPSDAEDRKVILVTDGVDDCHGPGSPYFPPEVIRDLRESGFKVRMDIVGFAVGRKNIADSLRDLAEVAGGTFYEAGNAEKLRAALRQTFNAPFEVRDLGGETIADGRVGGPAVEVPAGVYGVVIRAAGKDVRIDGVEIADRKTTLIQVDKEGRTVAARQPRLVAYERPGQTPPQKELSEDLEKESAAVTASLAPPPPSDRLRQLLDTAAGQLAADRLTAPPGDNAYETLRSVLEIDPDSREAKEGMVRIAERYLALSRNALIMEEFEKAGSFAAKGLDVSPGHEGLMAQRATVLEARAQQALAEQQRLLEIKEQEAKKQAMQQAKLAFLKRIDTTLLGPGVSDSVKTRLTKADRDVIHETYLAAFQIARDGEAFRWENNGIGHAGLIVLSGRFAGQNGEPCRVYRQIFILKGREERTGQSVACRQADGSWSQ